jgi:hypothetical protein
LSLLDALLIIERQSVSVAPLLLRMVRRGVVVYVFLDTFFFAGGRAQCSLRWGERKI